MPQISIHAAHAGCDDNPAQGHGVVVLFQSTQPMRAATPTAGGSGWRPAEFQSTQPMRAATRGRGARPAVCRFQSTQPMRAATLTCRLCRAALPISIHAAHAGCDTLSKFKNKWISKFQSTQPMRAATKILSPLGYLRLNTRININRDSFAA